MTVMPQAWKLRLHLGHSLGPSTPAAKVGKGSPRSGLRGTAAEYTA
jgi:hypothetical protein